MNNRKQFLIIGSAFLLYLLLPLANSHAQIFGPAIKYATQNSPRNIFIGDFNNDSRKDIALISDGGHAIEVLYQQSGGNFLSLVSLTGFTNLTAITGADFDVDGDIDLAVTDQSLNIIQIYLNNITNFFPGQTINCTQPYDIVTACLDNGHTFDLVVACISTNLIRFYEGIGDGTFNTTSYSAYTPSPGKLMLRNFDPMVIVPSWSEDSVSVFGWNYSPSPLHDSTYYSHGLIRSGVIGDFMPDGGYSDFALTCRSDSSIKMFEGVNLYRFHFVYSIEWPNFIPYEIGTADFDNDGDADLAVIDNRTAGKLWIGLQSGTNILGTLIDNIGRNPRDIAAADMNNDTYQDLVVTIAGDDSVAIFYNQLGAPSCQYTVGDANNSHSFNGLDVTYSVSYFKGGPMPPYSCDCPPHGVWYVAGDVNASCSFNGVDVTYMVSYFKGGSAPNPCPDCPPAR